MSSLCSLFSRRGFPGTIKSSRPVRTESETGGSRQNSGLDALASDHATADISNLTIKEDINPQNNQASN